VILRARATTSCDVMPAGLSMIRTPSIVSISLHPLGMKYL
jgi:hypothetical protein